MSEGDGATRAEETDDLFPVRDIETYRPEVTIKSSKLSANSISEEAMEFYLNFKGLTVSEMRKKFYKLSHIWYNKACFETRHAVHDVKNTWVARTGTCSEKMKVTSRLVMFYSIILALYVIKSCLRVDRELIEGLYKIFLNSKKNTQMLIGLGIVFSLIVVAYVIGAPCPDPATSTGP